MALHYTCDGHTFRADANGLAVEPGPKAITLGRQELERLRLQPHDEYQIPVESASRERGLTGRIFSALGEAMSRCRGPEEIWMAQDLKRAMILIGGLDEDMALRILDQKGLRGVAELDGISRRGA